MLKWAGMGERSGKEGCDSANTFPPHQAFFPSIPPRLGITIREKYVLGAEPLRRAGRVPASPHFESPHGKSGFLPCEAPSPRFPRCDDSGDGRLIRSQPVLRSNHQRGEGERAQTRRAEGACDLALWEPPTAYPQPQSSISECRTPPFPPQVRSGDKEGQVILLRLNDGMNSLLRVFVGKFHVPKILS